MLNKAISVTVLAFIAVLFFNAKAYAEPRPDQLDSERSIELQEELKGKPEGWLTKLLQEKKELKEKNGTSIVVLLNTQQQLMLNSASRQGQGLGSWYYNVELVQTLWRDAWMVADIEGGAGKGVDKVIPTFSKFDSNANELSLAYMPYFMLGQNFCDDNAYFAGGKIDLSDWFDINNVANSADTQFMSPALINNSTIPFPQKGLGFVGGAWIFEWLYTQMGVSNPDANATEIGLRDALKDTFIMTEIGIRPKFKGLIGNYRVMGWFVRKRLDMVADEETSQYGDRGVAISFDQQFTKRITAFFRYGVADKRVSSVASSWSAGFELDEPLPRRKYDAFSFGVSQDIMGTDYINSTDPKSALTETIFETYYSIYLNPLMSLTTDLQVVINPFATKKSPTAVVCSTRFLFLF